MDERDNPWTSRLSLLVLTHVAGTISIVLVLAMAPVVTRDLGLSAAEFGFFITAYYGAQAVCSIPAGALVTVPFPALFTVSVAHGAKAIPPSKSGSTPVTAFMVVEMTNVEHCRAASNL